MFTHIYTEQQHSGEILPHVLNKAKSDLRPVNPQLQEWNRF